MGTQLQGADIKTGRTWERAWLLAAIVAAAIMYVPTFDYLWHRWRADAQYSLAFLVPFVSGYFVWKKWPEVRSLKRLPSNAGLALLIVAVLLHLTGVVLDISGPSGVSLIISLIGFCLYFHGAALVRTLAFPLAYTVFMIPIPGGVLDLVGFPLQLWASGSTAAILRLMGLEVTRNGVELWVAGAQYQVAEACSGMSSLVALVGVTAVFAYITRLPTVYKWVLFALALPVALASNVVRITTIALVGHQWGQEAALNIYHDWSSPILFFAAVLMLFVINRGLEWLSGRRNTGLRR